MYNMYIFIIFVEYINMYVYRYIYFPYLCISFISVYI